MELVWGPELTYTESNSQVYKFLGSEKYQSVLNSIYAGLGVPPTLTGMAGNGGGFTNNFISLKTLVERLQYGRDLLVKFWHHELEIVRKAMGFRKGAHIHFDQMSLADETSEKNLLLQLADRDIISHETVLERFKEIAPVEKIRLRREAKARQKDTLPKKAGPYHNPQHDNEIEKIALNKDLLDNEEFLEDKGLPPREDEPIQEEPQSPQPQKQEPKNKMPQDPGRPSNVTDTKPRKKRVETPKSKPGLAQTILWANKSFDSISNIVNSAYLSMNGKSNLRQITKAEVHNLEKIKLDVLYNLEPMSSVDESAVMNILSNKASASRDFKKLLASKNVSLNEMSINDFRANAVSLFVEFTY